MNEPLSIFSLFSPYTAPQVFIIFNVSHSIIDKALRPESNLSYLVIFCTNSVFTRVNTQLYDKMDRQNLHKIF